MKSAKTPPYWALIAGLIVLYATNLAGIFGNAPFYDYGFSKSPQLLAVDLANNQKISNYTDWRGSGSCVHVSWAMLLRWHGRPDLADAWLRLYAGGEYHEAFVKKLEKHKIPYMTTNGEYDVEFLETAIAGNHGCIVTTNVMSPGDHMIVLIGLNDTHAYTLDSNDLTKIHKWPRKEFLQMWKISGSWATTTLLAPPPPKPYL